ncbi:MAG: energy-coupled thiamine transporter ThiT [Aerococcus sp.]|nr:energy-coupled thiamine transporter ThiT [Aerococcus sp.]
MKSSDWLVVGVECLVMTAIAIAINTVMGYIPFAVTSAWQLGSFMVMLFAFRRGPLPGFLSGLLLGFGQLVIDYLTMGTPFNVQTVLVAIAAVLFGSAGLFAKNLQRTLNNRRMSSVYLNLGTGTVLAVLAYFLVSGLIRFLFEENVIFQNLLQTEGIRTLASGALALVVLFGLLFIKSDQYIPRHTPYLTRRERSRLLND